MSEQEIRQECSAGARSSRTSLLRWTLYALALVVVLVVAVRPALLHSLRLAIQGRATVAERLGDLGPAIRSRLQGELDPAGLSYPPMKFRLLGLKHERELHLFVADASGGWNFIKVYDVTAASGELGPKLQEGDRQVPEGIYQIESLNPNSRFHLSLRLNYPNARDRVQAELSDRQDLPRCCITSSRQTGPRQPPAAPSCIESQLGFLPQDGTTGDFL